jgi:hypothetical protein
MGTDEGVPNVTEIDDVVLRDLESKFRDVLCPVHGSPPKFEIAPDGSVIEALCCESLLQIMRELQGKPQNEG